MVKMIGARRIDDARIMGGTILSAVSCQHASGLISNVQLGRNGAKLTAFFLRSGKRCGGEMEKEGKGGRGRGRGRG